MKPFRWDIKKKEQLGNLLTAEANPAYPEYEEQLLDCAVKVVARSQGRKLIFVGRSPENIFDYLSGIFDNSEQLSQLDILNISNRFRTIDIIKSEWPKAFPALKNHFTDLGLSPKQIIGAPNGICFCDLVSEGGTFENLFAFVKQWALEEKCDFPALTKKLSFLGITGQTKNSPNTWRWQQHADWVKAHNKISVKNVSIDRQLWDYLGNRQIKVSNANPPKCWAEDTILQPPRSEDNVKALRQAYDIYCTGRQQKRIFADKLAASQEIKQPWLRDLMQVLRKHNVSKAH
ncbi:MAG: hypothetical protein MJK04_32715 [Psychrosphaera sp.]|nr:hypothetical protein [Psychrosphaera sp.]